MAARTPPLLAWRPRPHLLGLLLGLLLLLLLLPLLLLQLQRPAAAATPPRTTLRLVLSDWINAAGDGLDPARIALYFPVSLNFFVAAHHFNTRREDVFPALAAVRGCALNVSVLAWCEEGSSPLRAARIVEEYEDDADYFVGFASLAAARTVAWGGAATMDSPGSTDGTSILTHWSASSSLSDKQEFPLFSRLQLADEDYITALAALVARLGYAAVALLHPDADTGPPFFSALQRALSAAGIALTGFPYTQSDTVTIRAAAKRLHESRLAPVIVMGLTVDITGPIANAFAEFQVSTDEDHLIILTNYDVMPDTDTLLASRNASLLARGSFAVVDGGGATSLFSSYVADWAQYDALVPGINTKIPPHGPATEFLAGCKNDGANYSLPLDIFSESAENGDPVWARAYDAVMAVGLAACAASPTAVAKSSAIHRAMLDLAFDGMSGHVAFSANGVNRAPFTVPIKLYNWGTASDAAAYSEAANTSTPSKRTVTERLVVGVFDAATSSWNLSTEDIVTRTAGSGGGGLVLPAQYVPPPTDEQLLNPELHMLAYLEVAFLNVACAALLALLIFSRFDRGVVRAQGALLAVAVVGTWLASWAILALAMDAGTPSSSSSSTAAAAPAVDPSTACRFGPFVFFLGFDTACAALLSRFFRVVRVFQGSGSLHTATPLSTVAATLGATCGALALLLAIWTAVSPLMWARFVDRKDAQGSLLQTHGSCYAPDAASSGFVVFFVVVHALFVLALWAVRSRAVRVPVDFFSHRVEGLATDGLAQLLVLAIPVTVAVYSSPLPRFIVLSTYVFFSCLVVLGFAVLPAVWHLVRPFVPGLRFGFATESGSQGSNKPKALGMRGSAFAADMSVAVSLREGLRIPTVREKFKTFLEEAHNVEPLLFLFDVQHWSDNHQAADARWRERTARGIFNTYVARGAFLEAGVGADARAAAELALRRPSGVGGAAGAGDEGPPLSTFDLANRAVEQRLTATAWTAFIADGGMYATMMQNSTSKVSHVTTGAMEALAGSAAGAAGGGAGAAAGTTTSTSTTRRKFAASITADTLVARASSGT